MDEIPAAFELNQSNAEAAYTRGGFDNYVLWLKVAYLTKDFHELAKKAKYRKRIRPLG